MRITHMTDQHITFTHGSMTISDFGKTRRLRITEHFQGKEIVAQLDLDHEEIREVILALGKR